MNEEQIQEAASFIKSKTNRTPVVGVVLGTGLNDLTTYIEDKTVLSYQQIPHFPVSTVAFHKGQLLLGTIRGVPVAVMQGRFHYYEGYSMQQLTFPIRVLKALGIRHLLVSNAAGGLNPDFKKGDLIITEDHINLLPDNPLRGLGASFGNLFTDMSAPYDETLQHLLVSAFGRQSLPVKKGVYVAVMGPSLETKAEYRWLRSTGADMVGMSTVPEVIVANQVALKCAAISVITDECNPDNLKPVNIAEIIEVAAQADKKLSKVFENVIAALGD